MNKHFSEFFLKSKRSEKLLINFQVIQFCLNFSEGSLEEISEKVDTWFRVEMKPNWELN